MNDLYQPNANSDRVADFVKEGISIIFYRMLINRIHRMTGYSDVMFERTSNCYLENYTEPHYDIIQAKLSHHIILLT